MAIIRLDKYLADMQVGTRSQVKEYIRKKRICVNGVPVTAAEYKLNTDNDIVTFDNVSVSYVENEYYMLNKPAGVLSATTDKNAPTVLDLIDCARKDLFPVGRLDKDTEGLLMITNDGELSHKLLSPKKHVDKVYYAKVAGRITHSDAAAFADGLIVDSDFKALPSKLEIINADKDFSEVYVTIQEGKFHQIKRMFTAIGSEVLYLKRLSMGSLKLDPSLKPGEYRKLTAAELESLKR